MKLPPKLPYIMVSLILVICLAFQNPQKGAKTLIHLPISETDFFLKDAFSNFITIDRVIKLETKAEGLISQIVQADVTNDGIFVLSQGPKNRLNLLAFSADGKFIRQLSARGKGPGEVNDFAGYYNDIKNKQLYLLDSRQKVVRMDYHGKVLAEFKCPAGAERMVCLDGNNLVFAALGLNSIFITDLNGKEIRHFISQKPLTPRMDNTTLLKVGKEVLYKPYLNDTLRIVKADSLKPRYLIDYGRNSLSPNQYRDMLANTTAVPNVPDQSMWGSTIRGATDSQICFFLYHSRKTFFAYSNLTTKSTYIFDYKNIINDPVLGKGFFPIGSFRSDGFIGIFEPAIMDLTKIPAVLKSAGPISIDDNSILVLYHFNFKLGRK